MKAIVIIGHGSRSREAQLQFMEVVSKVREKADELVEGAFMELAEPGFGAVVASLAAKGVDEIVVYPLFLFAGVHIKEDIPNLIEEVSKKHEGVRFSMAQPIGVRDELVDIVLNSVKGL